MLTDPPAPAVIAVTHVEPAGSTLVLVRFRLPSGTVVRVMVPDSLARVQPVEWIGRALLTIEAAGKLPR